ncbi:uncharacterized protein EAE97_011401 [Botrytis byssoidea]|uniref:Uncharacterized protein n=1 Tax=Botrytis byssoidea TaxID=139641 RepID=A0A9P5HW28_9HELO|nr:uncharacterized protein EAE97_011401 [Botrytis byssoidea]KAF7921133.1 hypothetical protein EAE97_011401 [Botrytis byssoidea]
MLQMTVLFLDTLQDVLWGISYDLRRSVQVLNFKLDDRNLAIGIWDFGHGHVALLTQILYAIKWSEKFKTFKKFQIVGSSKITNCVCWHGWLAVDQQVWAEDANGPHQHVRERRISSASPLDPFVANGHQISRSNVTASGRLMDPVRYIMNRPYHFSRRNSSLVCTDWGGLA